MKRIHQTQRGFAAIAAIFLVVVLAALGGFMVTFSNTQQLTSAQDVQGSRAYWAARAGLEWGLASASAAAACPASPTTLTVDGFTVVIACAANAYTEAGAPVNIYQFTSVASSAGAVGSVGFIERSLSASMER
jgi:MSHA biogenesis protein MshP